MVPMPEQLSDMIDEVRALRDDLKQWCWPRDVMTMHEAADYLRVSYDYFKTHWSTWGIPAAKAGRRMLFQQQDLKAWVSRHVHTDMPNEE